MRLSQLELDDLRETAQRVQAHVGQRALDGFETLGRVIVKPDVLLVLLEGYERGADLERAFEPPDDEDQGRFKW